MHNTQCALTLPVERTIPFHPLLARFFGDIPTAIYFQQLYFWKDKGDRTDGFIYKTKDEIEYETTLKRKPQDRARARLVDLQILETKLIRVNNTGAPILHYRIDVAKTQELINQFIQDETKGTNGGGNDLDDHNNTFPISPKGANRISPKGANRISPNGTNHIQENTTEITTYINKRENSQNEFPAKNVSKKEDTPNTTTTNTGLFDTPSNSYKGGEKKTSRQRQPTAIVDHSSQLETINYLKEFKNKIDELPFAKQRDYLYTYWNFIFYKRFNAKYLWTKTDFILLSKLMKGNVASQTLRAMDYALANHDWYIKKSGCSIKSLSFRYNELLSTKGGIYAT